MIIIILLYSLVTLATGSLPSLDPSHLGAPTRRVNLYEFNPAGVGAVSDRRKPKLPRGAPCAETDQLNNLLEAYPVIERLKTLCELTKIYYPGTIVNRAISDPYLRFHFGTRFIDVRVLRSLVRIAVNRRNPEEVFLKNACDIVKFLREKYPHVDFQYLNPQYILDWYKLLGTGAMKVEISTDAEQREIILHSNSDSPLLVKLVHDSWKNHFIRPRINRLRLTGYETTCEE